MSGFVVLNNKKYLTTLDYAADMQKSQDVQISITGETLSQTFYKPDGTLFLDKRWSVPILVDLYEQNPAWGCKEDLEAAYAEEYVPFTDIFGMQQGDVFIENNLPEQLRFAIVDQDAKFEVTLKLRLRQVS